MSTSLPHAPPTILIVDDERLSRRLAYRILTEEGYRVLEADGGPEALDVLRLARGQVDLLIVDVVMHGCDGVPSLNVPFLAKPYTRDEALSKVREALESRLEARTEAE
jgi:response regulator RpfG family c-di-GMP phosphodiesterase